MLYLNKEVHAFKNKMLNLFGEVENHGIRNCKLHVTIIQIIEMIYEIISFN